MPQLATWNFKEKENKGWKFNDYFINKIISPITYNIYIYIYNDNILIIYMSFTLNFGRRVKSISDSKLSITKKTK